MEIKMDAKELGQMMADHILGCQQQRQSKWTASFDVNDNEIVGVTFYYYIRAAPSSAAPQAGRKDR